MKNTILIALLLSCIAINAQTKKEFTENYDGGIATYQYYEDPETSEMVKDGPFKYVKKITNTNPTGSLSISITGNYKKGLRDGVFKFKIESIDFPNAAGHYTTKNETATLTYSNGLPNGLWEVSGNWKSRQYKLNYQTQKHYWTEYFNKDSEYAKVTFKNNIATGKFDFKNFSDKKNTSIQLSSNGFITGGYDFSDTYSIYNLLFSTDGLLEKSIVTNSTTSQIENKRINDENTIELALKYINGTANQDELSKNRVSVDTVTNGLTFLDYKSVFEQEPFLMIHFGGDKSIIKNDNSTNRVYNRFIDVRKFDFIDLNNDFAFRSAKNTRIDEEKLENLNKYLKDNSYRLKPNDKVKVESLIDEIQSKINEKEAMLKAKDLYYQNKDSLLTKLKSFRGFTFDGHLSYLASESLKPFSKSIIQMNQSLMNEYFKNLGTVNFGNNEDENFIELLNEINSGLTKYEQENQLKINEFNKAKELSKKADLANYKTLVLFSEVKQYDGQEYQDIYINYHSKLNPLSKDEEKLLKEYTQIQQELIERIKTTNDIDIIMKSLQNSLNISNALINMKGKVSKDDWKNIKKEKDIDNKIKILIKQ